MGGLPLESCCTFGPRSWVSVKNSTFTKKAPTVHYIMLFCLIFHTQYPHNVRTICAIPSITASECILRNKARLPWHTLLLEGLGAEPSPHTSQPGGAAKESALSCNQEDKCNSRRTPQRHPLFWNCSTSPPPSPIPGCHTKPYKWGSPITIRYQNRKAHHWKWGGELFTAAKNSVQVPIILNLHEENILGWTTFSSSFTFIPQNVTFIPQTLKILLYNQKNSPEAWELHPTGAELTAALRPLWKLHWKISELCYSFHGK